MWFIGVEVEQETSAPLPKKNPGSAPELTETIKQRAEMIIFNVWYIPGGAPGRYIKTMKKKIQTSRHVTTSFMVRNGRRLKS